MDTLAERFFLHLKFMAQNTMSDVNGLRKANHVQDNTAHNFSNDLTLKTMSHPRKTEVMDSVSDSR